MLVFKKKNKPTVKNLLSDLRKAKDEIANATDRRFYEFDLLLELDEDGVGSLIFVLFRGIGQADEPVDVLVLTDILCKLNAKYNLECNVKLVYK